MADFTLRDVVYSRILCPIDGWRDRLENEYIILTDAQKVSFIADMGYKRRKQTKHALSRYIDNPRLQSGINQDLGDFLDRLTWIGDRFILVGRQDAYYDANWVCSVIRDYL